ncbi:MAG: hypothetical protein HY814_14255 [Candidatus Riflebacteria bacterium]|nr:hypothetical protein [Candidatus Riflebacteria bacterium]
MPMLDSDALATYLEKVRKKAPLPKMVNQDSDLYALMKTRTDVVVVGQKAYRAPIVVRTGGAFSTANFNGANALGLGNAGLRKEYTASPYSMKQGKELSLAVEYHTNDPQKAVENVVESEMEDSSKAFAAGLDITAFTSGNGVLCAVVSGQGTTTMVVDDARKLLPGMRLTSYNATQSTQRTTADSTSNVDVVDVDHDSNTVTTTAAFTGTPAATDVLCLGGLSGATPATIVGLPGWHNGAPTGLVGGLDRATYFAIRTPFVTAGGQLTHSHGYQLLTKMRKKRGKSNVKKGLWVGSPTTWAGVAESATSMQTLEGPADGDGVPDWGFDIETDGKFCGRPFKQCTHAPDDRLDYFVPEAWARLVVEDVKLLKMGGNTIFPRYSTTDGSPTSAFLWYLIWEGAFMCVDTSAGGYISTLVKPAGY